jgi:hypothetical protein
VCLDIRRIYHKDTPAGSLIAASAGIFHIPLSRQLINRRLSFATLPRFFACPGSSSFIRSHASPFFPGRAYAGMDFARSGDLSLLWFLEETGGKLLKFLQPFCYRRSVPHNCGIVPVRFRGGSEDNVI